MDSVPGGSVLRRPGVSGKGVQGEWVRVRRTGGVRICGNCRRAERLRSHGSPRSRGRRHLARLRRAARVVGVSRRDAFDAVLAALNEAAFDDARLAEAMALIDEGPAG